MTRPTNTKWRLTNRTLWLQTAAFLVAVYASPATAAQALIAYCGGVAVTLGFYAGANVWADKVSAQAPAAPAYQPPATTTSTAPVQPEAP